jgi:hypothetical protein
MWMVMAVAALFVGATTHAAVVTDIKDVADFSHVFLGTEIHDGTGYQNGWAEFSPGDGTVFTDLGGGVLGIAETGRGVMLDGSLASNGSSTWVDNLVSPLAPESAYTIEFKLKVNDLPNGIRLWSGMGDGRDFVDVFNDGVTITQPGGGFLTVPMTINDSAAHTFRLANDGNVGGEPYPPAPLMIAHVWVDGVRLTEAVGNPWTSSGDDARLLFGDYTSGTFGDDANYEIYYFAHDQGGAFAPIPEPGTLALCGLALVGLIAMRRRR